METQGLGTWGWTTCGLENLGFDNLRFGNPRLEDMGLDNLGFGELGDWSNWTMKIPFFSFCVFNLRFLVFRRGLGWRNVGFGELSVRKHGVG